MAWQCPCNWLNFKVFLEVCSNWTPIWTHWANKNLFIDYIWAVGSSNPSLVHRFFDLIFQTFDYLGAGTMSGKWAVLYPCVFLYRVSMYFRQLIFIVWVNIFMISFAFMALSLNVQTSSFYIRKTPLFSLQNEEFLW